MGFLTAILTHLDAASVERQLDYLHAVSPGSRFVVCHGGARADFEQLTTGDAFFVDEPSLRKPPQEYTDVLTSVYESCVRDDPEVALAYFIEFDHLVLRGDFEGSLAELSERVGAGLLAKGAFECSDSNWTHFLRYRDDGPLNAYLTRISRRDDVHRRFGCLGTGMLFRREALEAFCSIPEPPPAYVELFIPTVVHHLGFKVADVDRHSDLYASVRWRPEYGVEAAIAEKNRGRTFVHPFKQLDALDTVRAA